MANKPAKAPLSEPEAVRPKLEVVEISPRENIEGEQTDAVPKIHTDAIPKFVKGVSSF